MSPRAVARPRTAPRAAPCAGAVLAVAARERIRRLVRTAFPRRRGRLVLVRTSAELARAARAELVDLVLVDGGLGDEAWHAVGQAHELPSAPFFLLLAPRPADAPSLARAAGSGVADVLFDGVDTAALDALVTPARFSARLATALGAPPPSLRLGTPLQHDVWRSLVAHAGRLTTTAQLAERFGVTREHLSRRFAEGGAPTLKRTIDLVRVCIAAELAKNPGYAVADVARILGFASSSQLAATTARVADARPSSLARLRTADLLERFAATAARHQPADA